MPATFFELTTALAFEHFRNKGCDAVVLEVGLGGKHDATNVITPVLSIITSIQLDHTKILGSTLEEIAREKAGIMKPGVDVIVGPHCPLLVMKVRCHTALLVFVFADGDLMTFLINILITADFGTRCTSRITLCSCPTL